MVPFVVRSPKPHEMDQLTKLWAAFLQDSSATDLEFVPDSQSLSRWQDHVRKRLEDDPRQVLVAKVEGKVVGYLLYSTKVDIPLTRRYDYAMISDLYVSPEYRRRGIAGELIETCLRQLRDAGATHVRLQVLARNEAATSLYRRYGFLTHDLIMQLELQS